ncbi:MAG TPA: hypothetical protein VGI17_13510 [Solirubrobacterales bacterium]|jgi:hypothetical protein
MDPPAAPLPRVRPLRLLSLEGKYAAVVAVGTVIVRGAVFASIEGDHGITTWDD